LHIALGDRLDLKIEDGKIVLERAQTEYRLDDMLARITKDNQHAPADFGAPVGREAW
jgi:antitoxin component of MazEF toxin-antitoxin module